MDEKRTIQNFGKISSQLFSTANGCHKFSVYGRQPKLGQLFLPVEFRRSGDNHRLDTSTGRIMTGVTGRHIFADPHQSQSVS